jgi:isopentenyl diphosphate isomerase/L-lactate dehydrogenase-like FMN-dependent dehydrogenase
LLGRPPLWALACGGSAGLERMLATLKRDLEDDLRSLGVTSLKDLGPRRLWPPDRQRVEAAVQACREA